MWWERIMRLVQAHEVPALTAVVSPEASACQCRARCGHGRVLWRQPTESVVEGPAAAEVRRNSPLEGHYGPPRAAGMRELAGGSEF